MISFLMGFAPLSLSFVFVILVLFNASRGTTQFLGDQYSQMKEMLKRNTAFVAKDVKTGELRFFENKRKFDRDVDEEFELQDVKYLKLRYQDVQQHMQGCYQKGLQGIKQVFQEGKWYLRW